MKTTPREAFYNLTRALARALVALVTLALLVLAALFDLLAAALDAVGQIVPRLIRCTLAITMVLSMVWTIASVYAAFRADPPALLPALAAGVLPAVYGIANTPYPSRRVESGLVFGLVVTAGIGAAAQVAPPEVCALALGGVRAAGAIVVVNHLLNHRRESHERKDRDVLGVGGDSAAHSLQRDQESQSDSEHAEQ